MAGKAVEWDDLHTDGNAIGATCPFVLELATRGHCEVVARGPGHEITLTATCPCEFRRRGHVLMGQVGLVAVWKGRWIRLEPMETGSLMGDNIRARLAREAECEPHQLSIYCDGCNVSDRALVRDLPAGRPLIMHVDDEVMVAEDTVVDLSEEARIQEVMSVVPCARPRAVDALAKARNDVNAACALLLEFVGPAGEAAIPNYMEWLVLVREQLDHQLVGRALRATKGNLERARVMVKKEPRSSWPDTEIRFYKENLRALRIAAGRPGRQAGELEARVALRMANPPYHMVQALRLLRERGSGVLDIPSPQWERRFSA